SLSKTMGIHEQVKRKLQIVDRISANICGSKLWNQLDWRTGHTDHISCYNYYELNFETTWTLRRMRKSDPLKFSYHAYNYYILARSNLNEFEISEMKSYITITMLQRSKNIRQRRILSLFIQLVRHFILRL
ncbi:hypothetical protein L9F63_023455, partial [Diploptera punctata]